MMQALRQFYTAEKGLITIQLPADFPSTEVEVTVFPKRPIPTDIINQQDKAEDDGQAAIQAFLTMDITHFTPEEQQAYERTCMLLRQERRPNDLPIFGLFEGLIKVTDNDLTDPLPDDIIDLF